jgi:nitrogen fixation protein FixH
MSHIRWIPPPSDKMPRRAGSLWRLFPLAVIVAMSVVVAVNAGLVYAALYSFPGKAGDEGFDLSNHYDAVLERAQREAALGWTMLAQTDEAGLPMVTLTGRDGSPLRGASVAATAERPLGALATHRLAFHETSPGRYVAGTALTPAGQWDLTLSASTDGRGMTATRRIIVR